MQFPYMTVRHFSLPYTGLAWLYIEFRDQNILQQGGNESGLQMLISFVWNIFTLRYDTFLHTFLCSTTYQKLVFYAGIPLTTGVICIKVISANMTCKLSMKIFGVWANFALFVTMRNANPKNLDPISSTKKILV